jgi:spermidine synthase
VSVVNADAWKWLESRPTRGSGGEPFDAIVLDLPDPSHYGLGRLYSAPFYRLVMRHLAPDGLVATQATSPIAAREAFWCIVATMEAAGLRTTPYHATVPSFGDWGFVIASRDDYRAPASLPEGLAFLTPEVLQTLFVFSPDVARLPVEANQLDHQQVVRYYDRGWRRDRE